MRITEHTEQIVTEVIRAQAGLDQPIDHEVFLAQLAGPTGPQLAVAIVLSMRGVLLGQRVYTNPPLMTMLFAPRPQLEKLISQAVKDLQAECRRQVQAATAERGPP